MKLKALRRPSKGKQMTSKETESTEQANLWPPRCALNFYDRNLKPLAISGQRDRRLDLSDMLMLYWPHKTRVVHFGFRSKSTRMVVWDDDSVAKIERLIRHDLDSDGYRVTIRRETSLGNPCSDEFVWRLAIRPA